MALRVIKPTAANTAGMTAAQTRIGVDCKNARVWIRDVRMDDDGFINFIASYFWNLAAWNTYQAETADIAAAVAAGQVPPARTVVPWREEGYRFQGDPEAAPRAQAQAHLLAQPQFAGGFE